MNTLEKAAYYQPVTYFKETHPIHLELTPKWVRAYFEGVAVADSRNVLLMREENHLPVYYFYREDVRLDLLQNSEKVTRCPYKGRACYYSVKIGNQLIENIAWYYRYPTTEAAGIEDRFCFYNEEVDLYVDGELQERPETKFSSG